MATTQPVATSGKPASMNSIGFKQDRGVGRVSIKMSGPVQIGVKEDVDRNVVVSLENARIGLPNNERFLDTSFFDTAVAMVRPEPSAKGVNVLVVLKQPVPYRVSQSNNEVTVEFEPPK
ncbi:MAG: hypothetical protein IPJ65_07840 [Archangiaceae bacterium]|nr:hypothetical protein [Archangiaceae bacterium]